MFFSKKVKCLLIFNWVICFPPPRVESSLEASYKLSINLSYFTYLKYFKLNPFLFLSEVLSIKSIISKFTHELTQIKKKELNISYNKLVDTN